MIIALRAFSRRDLPITKRDWLALNALDRIRLRIVQEQLFAIISAITIVNQSDCDGNERILPLLLILLFLSGQYQNILEFLKKSKYSSCKYSSKTSKNIPTWTHF